MVGILLVKLNVVDMYSYKQTCIVLRKMYSKINKKDADIETLYQII